MEVFRCRASAVGLIMTNGRGKSTEMGDTCKSYLRLWHREQLWGRQQEIKTKYMTKGIEEEESAITLLSLEEKKMLFKTKEEFSNEYLTGHPDILEESGIVWVGEPKKSKVLSCEEGFDTKCSYTWETFPHQTDGNDPKYDWQNNSYMALSGAKQWATAYCLVNSSGKTIDDEKKKMQWRLNCIDPEHSDEYLQQGKEIEKNHIYDLKLFLQDNPRYDLLWDEKEWRFDIPRSERLVKFVTLRDEEKINAIYTRVEECRQWITDNLK